MGCNSSKKNQKLKTQTTLLGKKTPKNTKDDNFKQIDPNDIENDWINAVKNENLKEGSLINPPDDLAKDTKLEVALNKL